MLVIFLVDSQMEQEEASDHSNYNLMNKKNYLAGLIFIFFSQAMLLQAQPNYIYTGGDGNGYSGAQAEGVNLMLYEGSYGNGYSGGQADGVNLMLYEGSYGNGYSGDHADGVNLMLYEGSYGNGYSSFLDFKDFIWTGGVGQSWTIAGNWNYNTVPTIARRTIIPTGVPAYPHINAGLFAIGENPNNGAYKSRELWIQEGALLVTRVNCKVENYGLITVDGQLKIKNKSITAFLSKAGSEVIVTPLGVFIFQ